MCCPPRSTHHCSTKARTKLGVKPVAPPPVYLPSVVVDAILHAAEHPVRDLVVGGSARALLAGEALAPRAVDALLRTWGVDVHYTEDPKGEDAPDNLFAPIARHDTVEGTVGEHARRCSASTWLALHPSVGRASAAAVLGAAFVALLAQRASTSAPAG